MVQGSYPRYVDEEKQGLLTADEENQFETVDVKNPVQLSENEVAAAEEEPQPRCRWSRWRARCRKNREERKKRPLWRRVLRFFVTVFMFMFVWHAVVKPVIWGVFGTGWMGCGRHMNNYDPVVVKIGEATLTKPKTHFDFDASEVFFIKQEHNAKVPTKTNVFGAVNVFPSDDDKTSVDFHVKVSDERLWDAVKIDPRKCGIAFSADAFSLVEQFINVTAVIKLSKSADLKKLFINTRELDVKFHDVDNHFDVSRVSTVAGNVFIHGRHDSKCAKIHSVSGDVRGSYTLTNALGIKTVSGKIDANVFPVELDEKKAWFGTDSVSGVTTVHVHKLKARNLKTWHRTTSGDLSVRYPEEWQGSMKITTTSGDFDVIGKNLKIIKKKKGLAGKFWKLIKGDGVSKAKVTTVSGNVKVSVGDE